MPAEQVKDERDVLDMLHNTCLLSVPLKPFMYPANFSSTGGGMSAAEGMISTTHQTIERH